MCDRKSQVQNQIIKTPEGGEITAVDDNDDIYGDDDDSP